VPLSSFTIESRALPSGAVEVSGSQSETGLSRLVVRAFGRHVELDQTHLRQLEGMTVNGLELTYEYANGPTLYVLFRRGHVEQRPTVPEQGGIVVGPRKPAERPPN